MQNTFLQNTSLITYNQEIYNTLQFTTINDISLTQNHTIQWLNTYGIDFIDEFKAVVNNNDWDDFLKKLLSETNHQNKVLELDNLLFITIKVLKAEPNQSIKSEQIFFIVTPNTAWSIQERKGDHFGWIRTRIAENKGIVRTKKADYLLFLLLESMIDNYEHTFSNITQEIEKGLEKINIKPTPDFASKIEKEKQLLYQFKKATSSLRDTIIKLEKIQNPNFNAKYYSELKEQINNLIADIDFDLQELESKINLIFSFQSHHLNEIMKTLTIFSVIFIPLTFIAGIYGMNFSYMPELETKNGYFVLLSIMGIIVLISIGYFKKKKWF